MGIKNNQYDAKIIENYVKKEEINVQNISVSKLFKNILHPGEREALSLAKKRGALLIMDEKKARFIAHQNNIICAWNIRGVINSFEGKNNR